MTRLCAFMLAKAYFIEREELRETLYKKKKKVGEHAIPVYLSQTRDSWCGSIMIIIHAAYTAQATALS